MSITAFFVKMDLDTPLYLTDYHRNVEYNGNTYISGLMKINASVVQKAIPSASNFKIILSATVDGMIDHFTGSNYKNKPCIVNRMEFNESEVITNVSVWLNGLLNSYEFINKTSESTIVITVSTLFAAFDSVNGLGILQLFSDTINEDTKSYWGKQTPPSSTSRGRGNNYKFPIDQNDEE